MSALPSTTVASILAAADDLRDELVMLLRHGVQIPSVNPAFAGGTGEGRFQEFVAEQLARLGAHLDVWEPEGAVLAERYGPTLQTSTCDFRGRPNVVGVFDPAGDAGRRVHLILNSHADTVAADVARWKHDPFAAEVEDGWLCGLGAADAKGCLVAQLGALSVLRAAGICLRASVALTSVVDEEAGGGGTLACIARDYQATGALIGEPTSLAVCPGSRGAFGLKLTVRGRGAHLGVAYDGVNAIEHAGRYIQAFNDLALELDRDYRHPLWRPLPAGHVFSVTQIASDPAPGSVPSRCEVRFSAGYMAGETRTRIRQRIEAAFGPITRADPWLSAHPPDVELTGPFIDAAATPLDHPLVADLVGAATDLGLPTPPVQALSAGTDGRLLTNEGGTPAINFGPGEMSRAHGPDEALHLDEFLQAVAWIAVAVA
ncbi:MAG: M20/M25/M40 family metallo-hydrolase, partial [Trebonia sp.]